MIGIASASGVLKSTHNINLYRFELVTFDQPLTACNIWNACIFVNDCDSDSCVAIPRHQWKLWLHNMRFCDFWMKNAYLWNIATSFENHIGAEVCTVVVEHTAPSVFWIHVIYKNIYLPLYFWFVVSFFYKWYICQKKWFNDSFGDQNACDRCALIDKCFSVFPFFVARFSVKNFNSF